MATDLIERITLPKRRTPVYKSVDVLVCGGGIAGVCAAVTVARAGANVLLVERNVVLGGNAPLSFAIDLPVSAGGLGAEIEARLIAGGEAGVDAATGGLAYEPEAHAHPARTILLVYIRPGPQRQLAIARCIDYDFRGDREPPGLILHHRAAHSALVHDRRRDPA